MFVSIQNFHSKVVSINSNKFSVRKVASENDLPLPTKLPEKVKPKEEKKKAVNIKSGQVNQAFTDGQEEPQIVIIKLKG